MSSIPSKSNRGKGYTSVEAKRALADLPESIKAALGEGGVMAMAELADQAPGTFFHAMSVNELMKTIYDSPDHQSAVLLHDIGKVLLAPVFAENAIGDQPRPASEDILTHVEYGKVLARHYQLSDLQYSAINEHHGTLPLGPDANYVGNTPQSQFTAALMMADTIEAVHASGILTESLLEDIFHSRENQWISINRAQLLLETSRFSKAIMLNPSMSNWDCYKDSPTPTPAKFHLKPQI